MIARSPYPTVEELRLEMARREAELAQRRAARLRSAWTTSARISEEHTRRRVEMEHQLADAVARVATSAAMCGIRIEGRVAGAAR